MVSRFFSHSKPINFFVVGSYMILFFIISRISVVAELSLFKFFGEIGILFLLLLSIFIMNFVSERNDLTGRNSLKILLFVCLICLFPQIFHSGNIVIANFFILLAFRRLISLRSQRKTIHKIFDASLWIGVASLFHFWAILYLFLVYAAILFHVGHKIRNWLVPIVGILTLFILATCFDLMINNSFFDLEDWLSQFSLDFSQYRDFRILIGLSFFSTLMLWALFFYILTIRKVSANSRPSMLLIIFYLTISLGIILLSPDKTSSEFLFIVTPVAVIITNYLQIVKDYRFKEALLFAVVIVPLLLLFFH